MQRVCGQSPSESRPPKLLVTLASPPSIQIIADNFNQQLEAQRLATVIEALLLELMEWRAAA